MGCDIHSYVERKINGVWEYEDTPFEPFGNRSYSVFAFLAGVRNYDCCEPICERRGLPYDCSDYVTEEYDRGGWHSCSYLMLDELLDYDYSKTFWNRRVSKQIAPNMWSGRELAEEGEGVIISYRDNLGEHFFKDLEALSILDEPENIRIVFWFDN